MITQSAWAASSAALFPSQGVEKEQVIERVDMLIAIDFDGTVVDHRYPSVGPDLPKAVEVLRELVARGDKLILWTMRSGTELDDAIRWFKDRNITLWGVNKNPEQKTWTTSPKAYAQLYIDDAAFGIPLVQHEGMQYPGVDWRVIQISLISCSVLK